MDGPTKPKKQGPASAATENGAKTNRKSSQQKNTKSKAAAQESERHFLTVTHGQVTAGYIEQKGKAFKATAVDGRALGIFANLKAAADAVSAAHGGAR